MSSSLMKSIVLGSALVILLSCGSKTGRDRAFLENVAIVNELETDGGYSENSAEFCLQRVKITEAGKAEERIEIAAKRCPSNNQLADDSAVIGSARLSASGNDLFFVVADDNADMKYGKIVRQGGILRVVALCAYGTDADRSAVYNNCWIQTQADGRVRTFHRTRQ